MRKFSTDPFTDEDKKQLSDYVSSFSGGVFPNHGYNEVNRGSTMDYHPENIRLSRQQNKIENSNVSASPEYDSKYDSIVENASKESKLDPHFIKSFAMAESGFDNNAVSPAGAIGITQLTPIALKELKNITGRDFDPYDPQQNVTGGSILMKHYIERFGNVEKGIAAYNAGPSRVEKANGVPDIKETRNYVERVLGNYKSFKTAK